MIKGIALVAVLLISVAAIAAAASGNAGSKDSANLLPDVLEAERWVIRNPGGAMSNQCERTIEDGALRIDITRLKDQAVRGDTGVGCINVPATVGKTYTLRFSAKASEPREINISSLDPATSGESTIGQATTSLKTAWQTYVCRITLTRQSTPTTRLPFFAFGDKVGTVWFRNVTLVPEGASVPAATEAPAPAPAAGRNSAASDHLVPGQEGGAAGAGLTADNWDWPSAMQKVTKKFTGKPGVVLHVGDSITYASGYGQWARRGDGQTQSDKEVLAWMHTGQKNELDGWYLAAFDVPGLGRSYTAAGGMRLDQAIEGGCHGLDPMAGIIKKYNPQVVVMMLGTNDASADRPVTAYKADLEKTVRIVLNNNTILVLSTIPPHINKQALAQQYNGAIMQVAREQELPMIDFYGAILARQPGMAWDGTLLSKNDVHPTAEAGDLRSTSEPTPGNLARVGYLLRGWLSVQKLKEVKMKAIDPAMK